MACIKKGEVGHAIENCNTAIQLNPDFAKAYNNRGEAWLHLQDWKKAKADLTIAKNMDVDIIASFHNDYESIADFEQKHGVQVPEDIAAMLTQR